MNIKTFGFEVGIAAIKGARQKLDDMAGVAKDAAEAIAASIKENIESSRTPFGNSFVRLSKSTMKARRAHPEWDQSMRPLIRTRALIDSIAARMGEAQALRARAVVGFVPWYGQVHNMGGGPGGRIPRRPFLGVSSEASTEISEQLHGFVVELFGRGRLGGAARGGWQVRATPFSVGEP